MSVKEFLNYCTTCGGDWVSMMMSGIKTLFPDEYYKVLNDVLKLKGHGGVLQFAYIAEWLETNKGIKAD